MAAVKQAKLVHDGKSYWVLWHWEVVTRPLPHLTHSVNYADGPFSTLEDAEHAAKGKSSAEGWEIISFPPTHY